MLGQIQVIIIGASCVLVWLLAGSVAALAALCGAAAALLNSYLVARHTARQSKVFTADGKASVRMVVQSVLIRMTLVSFLLGLGFLLFQAQAGLVIGSFALGQIGFLFDKVINGG